MGEVGLSIFDFDFLLLLQHPKSMPGVTEAKGSMSEMNPEPPLASHTHLSTSAPLWPGPPPCLSPPYSGLVGLEGRGVHMGSHTEGEEQGGLRKLLSGS